MITVDQVRRAVSADSSVREFFGDEFTVANYAWENNDIYLMSVEAADGVALFDAPVILVEKSTGAVILRTGLLGRPPAADLAWVRLP